MYYKTDRKDMALLLLLLLLIGVLVLYTIIIINRSLELQVAESERQAKEWALRSPSTVSNGYRLEQE